MRYETTHSQEALDGALRSRGRIFSSQIIAIETQSPHAISARDLQRDGTLSFRI